MPSWTSQQDEELADHIRHNRIIVDRAHESDRNYLWTATQSFFPEFCGQGAGGKENAIRRIRKKIRQWNLHQTLSGARRQGEGK